MCRSWHLKTVTAEWNMGSWCWVGTTTGQKLFEDILWSDKAVFHIGGFVKRHNCHYWAAHDPEVTVEKMQNLPKVTVWCGMTATRVISPYLLRDTMNDERCLQMLEDYVWSVVSGWENIDELVFMHDGAPPHFALSVLPGWIRSFRDVGWDDEDLTNGLQEVQISRPVTFSCGAGQRRCTGQNFAQWNNWRTGFGTLSPTSHTTSCRRLWIPSPVVWGSWWMPPVPTLNFKLCVHIPI